MKLKERSFLLLLRLISFFSVVQTLPLFGAEEFSVYQVYQNIDLGTRSGGTPIKNYYINMGKAHGLQVGSYLQVLRKVPMVHDSERRFHQDLSFPFAHIKIIHVQLYTAIGKLEKFLPPEETPSIAHSQAIMVGDEVRPLPPGGEDQAPAPLNVSVPVSAPVNEEEPFTSIKSESSATLSSNTKQDPR